MSYQYEEDRITPRPHRAPLPPLSQIHSPLQPERRMDTEDSIIRTRSQTSDPGIDQITRQMQELVPPSGSNNPFASFPKFEVRSEDIEMRAIEDEPISETEIKSSLIRDPGPYKGEKEKFRTWHRNMNNYVHFQGEKISDQQKILMWTSRMTGKAELWAMGYESYCEKKQWSYNHFLFTILDDFQDTSEATIAQRKIRALRQGNQDVGEFLTEFEALKILGKISDDHAIALLEQNLSFRIIAAIANSGTKPSTYNGWIEKAKAIGRAQNDLDLSGRIEERRKTQFSLKKRSTNYPRNNYYIPKDSNQGTPMEIDRKKPNWTRDGKPKCFNCGEYGHMAKNCQKPKRPMNRRNQAIQIEEEEEQDFQEREE